MKKVFTSVQEQELVDYAIQISKMFYGLPRNDFRRLAFNYAKACDSPSIPANWHESEIASDDWYYAFMNRHPELSLKAPEGVSIARATASTPSTSISGALDTSSSHSTTSGKISIQATGIYVLLYCSELLA